MNRYLLPYYLSRGVLSIAFGGLFWLTGSPLWEAALIGGLLLALFLWAPHSGRYSVHPEFGVTALRRDERTQVVNDKAARNAFVAVMLALAAASLYWGSAGAAVVSIGVLKILLIGGTLIYFASDLWFRKA